MREKNYWFLPKRFWKWFAAYYPVAWEGWITLAVAVILLVYFFIDSDGDSHSVSDTLIDFAPKAVAVLFLFDVITRLKGEYPSWWREVGGKD